MKFCLCYRLFPRAGLSVEFVLLWLFLNPNSVKIVKSQQAYRNPINLAKEYKEVIKSGQARNEADLARNIGVSRGTVNPFISLLKLTLEVI